MSRCIFFALWIGCRPEPDIPGSPTPPLPPPPARNGLRVNLAMAPGTVGVSRLDVLIDHVALVADGPDGPVNIATASPNAGDLTDGPVGLTLDLPTGRYRDLQLTLTLEGDPGLGLEALWEGQQIVVELPGPIQLRDEAPELILADGPDQEVRFILHPSRWLEELDLDEMHPEAGTIRIDPHTNRDAYEELLDILADTEGDLDDAPPDD